MESRCARPFRICLHRRSALGASSRTRTRTSTDKLPPANGTFVFFSPQLPPKHRLDEFSLHKQHSFVLGSNQFTASQNRQLEKSRFSPPLVDFLLPPSSPSPETPDLSFRVDPGAWLRGLSESDSQWAAFPSLRSSRQATGDRPQATGHRRFDHWRRRGPFFALNPKRQGGQLAFGSANRSRVVSRRKEWTVDGQPHHLSQQLHLLPFPQDSRAPSLSFPNSRPRQEEASISPPISAILCDQRRSVRALPCPPPSSLLPPSLPSPDSPTVRRSLPGLAKGLRLRLRRLSEFSPPVFAHPGRGTDAHQLTTSQGVQPARTTKPHPRYPPTRTNKGPSALIPRPIPISDSRMMATESLRGRSDEATLTSQPEPVSPPSFPPSLASPSPSITRALVSPFISRWAVG